MYRSIPIWIESLVNLPSNLRYHLAHPEEPFDSYYRRRKLERAQAIVAKKKIYLDQKYWIYCRKVEMGNPDKSVHVRIYEVLMSLVSQGIAVCPASHLVLEETMKQSDLKTRQATGTVIDKLSRGLALEPIPFLDSLDWFCYFQNLFARETNSPFVVRDDFAWTWSSYILGTQMPHSTAWDDETNAAFQKDFFDSCTHLKFSDVLMTYDSVGFSKSLLETDEFIEHIRRKNCEHKTDVADFRRALFLEAAGTIKAHQEQGTIEEALRQEHYHRTGRWPTEDEVLSSTEMLSELAFRVCCQVMTGTVCGTLPCVHILAGIHAKERNNKHKWEVGDGYDSLHARCALPYCDYFLTEKTIGYLLVQPPLCYDHIYDCRVLWRDEEILEVMGDLLLKSSEEIS